MDYFNYKIKEEISLIEWFKKTHLAKNKVNYLIDNNCCYNSNNVLSRNSILSKGDNLYIDLSNFIELIDKTYSYDLDIIYEDEYLLIINKPSGFIIYDSIKLETITNMVNGYLSHKGITSVAYPCHRLDLETSGCLIYCKDIITLAYLSSLFEENKIQKDYLALVEGITDNKEIIDKPIGQHRHLNNTMIVSKTGKKALTSYVRLKSKNNVSLLRVSINTGRTHQIRVHLSFISHPIIGDEKYGSKVKASRIMLHCERITFFAIDGHKMSINAKIPTIMNKLVN